MPYIYKITNDINNKIYIGKTSTTVEQRWSEHKADFNCQSKQHRPLYSAMRKYGLEHFSISQIEEVDTDDIACEREIFWIEHYGSFKNGYNVSRKH